MKKNPQEKSEKSEKSERATFWPTCSTWSSKLCEVGHDYQKAQIRMQLLQASTAMACALETLRQGMVAP